MNSQWLYITAIYTHKCKRVFERDFVNRGNNEAKDAREIIILIESVEFDLSTSELREVDCPAKLVRFAGPAPTATSRIYDANESNEKLFRRRCKWGARARATTTRPMYLHLSEPRGLMEKRFGSSAARDNWSQFPDLIDIVLDKYLEGVS